MRLKGKAIAEGAGLVLALTFVFLMAFTPHLATSDQAPAIGKNPLERLSLAAYQTVTGARHVNPYPIHVDEHFHWVYITAIENQKKIALDHDPYTGQNIPGEWFFSLKGAVHERGFRLIVVEIQELTGVSFLRIFEFLPAIWLTLTAFGMYAALRPHPAALPAAAFVALIPTTVRFMGPAFLVPIGFVLAWLPAALILAEPAKRFAGGAALLTVTLFWAFFVHLIGGFAAVGLLAIGGLLGGVKNLRSALTLVVITIAPLVWLHQAFAGSIQGELQREDNLPIDFTIFDNLGLVGLFAWMAGVGLYTWARRERRSMALTSFVGGSVGMLGLIVLGIIFHWGRYATYARWHPPFFLAAAVPLGYGVATVAEGLKKVLQRTYAHLPLPKWSSTPVGVAAGFALVGFLVAPGVDKHLDEPYYRILDDRDWARFEFATQHVSPDYQVFLTHPWKAPTLLAMSGKIPFTVLYPGEPPFRGPTYDAFARTGLNLEFYILNDVTLVVADLGPPIPQFVNLGHEGVWGLRPDIAHELAQIRAQERGVT